MRTPLQGCRFAATLPALRPTIDGVLPSSKLITMFF